MNIIETSPVMTERIRPLTENIAEVKRMYVRSKSSGIGSEILNYLERKAAEYGYAVVRLETRLVNEQAVCFEKTI